MIPLLARIMLAVALVLGVLIAFRAARTRMGEARSPRPPVPRDGGGRRVAAVGLAVAVPVAVVGALAYLLQG